MLQRMRGGLPCLALVAGLAAVPAGGAQGPPCGLLNKAEIAKATGLAVGDGVVGPAIPGVLGKCTWTAGHSRVILTLADARHMQLTVDAQKQTGGTEIQGLGTTAVGIKGAPFNGGGYIVSVLDAKGGFGMSILGSEGNRDRAVALAKIAESHR